jgi:hypothetical protein
VIREGEGAEGGTVRAGVLGTVGRAGVGGGIDLGNGATTGAATGCGEGIGFCTCVAGLLLPIGGVGTGLGAGVGPLLVTLFISGALGVSGCDAGALKCNLGLGAASGVAT